MQIILFLLLILNLISSIWLYTLEAHNTFFNYLYNFSYGLNFLLGLYYCFSRIPKYFKFRALLIYFGLASLSFFVAQLIWLYYNLYATTAIPYPSIADYFWLAFYPLIGIGFMLLLKALKSTLNLSMLIEIIITAGVIFLVLSSFLSLNNTTLNLPILTVILDYAYPIFDSIIISIAIAALRSQAGRLHSQILYFVFGFIGLAVGDTLFTYQTALNTYWNGNIVDAIYAISCFLIMMGFISLPALVEEK